MSDFGELRLVRDGVGTFARLLYRVMGVADPGHYLHHRYVARSLASLSGFQPKAILDAGCGMGDHTVWLARRYPGATVKGIDIDESRIARNQAAVGRLSLPNIRFEAGDLTKLDLDRQIDLVVSVDVLEHVPDQAAALRNLCRALVPGGFAVFHVPTRRERPVPLSGHLSDFHAWGEHEHLAEEATASEFAERVRQAGFEVDRSTRTFGYWTGELAVSLFFLFFKDTARNRVLQACLAPFCRGLLLLDPWVPQRTRYATCVVARRPGEGSAGGVDQGRSPAPVEM